MGGSKMKPITSDDIKIFLLSREGLSLEMKKCRKDKLPESLWETYSAFANTRGGVILLGVDEDKKKPLPERFEITGVGDANKLVEDLFNMLNNPQKVTRCVLVDSDVQIVNVDGKNVIYIHVPEAYYRQKPIYINNDIQNGTFKRLHEGDRHVTSDELAMLIRDSTDNIDSQIIPGYGLNDIDAETLRKYRQTFTNRNPGHPYEELSDKDFLIQMGGYVVDGREGVEGLTMAGMLMFGKSVPIHRNFPNFRFDYLDLFGIEPGDSKKWNDRLTDDGRWVDNIYNFVTLALNKLLFTLPSEGRLKGVIRIDGGELYEGVREAFTNCITYCDYLLGGVLRIDRRTGKIVMRNPGTLRIPPERIYNGDYTFARNVTIQKMLRMVGFGDNIGSGFSKIMKAWKTLDYPAPSICEEPEVNEVWLTLPLPNEVETVNDNVNSDDGVNDGINEIVYKAANEDESWKIRTNDSINDGLNDGLNTTDERISKIQRLVLDIIISNPTVTTSELCHTLNLSESSITRATRGLKKLEIIARKGSKKTGYWIVNKNFGKE